MQNLSELKTSALCKSKKKVFIFGSHLQIFKVESVIDFHNIYPYKNHEVVQHFTKCRYENTFYHDTKLEFLDLNLIDKSQNIIIDPRNENIKMICT